MNLLVLDTDVLTHFKLGQTINPLRLLTLDLKYYATTVISIEEQLSGWYAFLRRAKTRAQQAHGYERLAEQIRFLGQLQVISYTIAAMDRFDQLKALKLNIGQSDLKIAAIVLDQNATLVTLNRRDFSRVPDLKLFDWANP